MTKCGMPLASRPTCTATTCKSWFVKLETVATHTRTTAETEIHFNCTPVLSLTNAKLLLERNPKKLKMTNPSEIYASSKSCDLGEDRNGVLAARRVNEQK